MKFIALGSNLPSVLGSPMEHLRLAIKHLEQVGFQILSRASVYQSAPVPVSDQPDFMNTVVQVEFSGTLGEALAACHEIEKQMGRVRGAKNEARIIDIDILAWDGVVQSCSPELPHPRMHERAFVMLPLADIAPNWRHPVRKETAAEITKSLPPVAIQKIAEKL